MSAMSVLLPRNYDYNNLFSHFPGYIVVTNVIAYWILLLIFLIHSTLPLATYSMLIKHICYCKLVVYNYNLDMFSFDKPRRRNVYYLVS